MIDGQAVRERLRRLVGRYGLEDSAEEQLWGLLQAVNTDPHVPTRLTDPLEALDEHLADSLVALELDCVRSAGVIGDIGSGAGFPGLPLAAALPAASVFLVESNRRKCEFIMRAATAAGIGNATAVVARAEEWRAGRERCDLITSRALASLPVVAEYAAPLLRLGGALVAWRGHRDPAEDAAARTAAAELHLSMGEPVPAKAHSLVRERYLQVFTKLAPTPERFPRRAGVARKRPLGARAGERSRSAPSDREQR